MKNINNYKTVLLRLIENFIDPRLRKSAMGDYEESYYDIKKSKNFLLANYWLLFQLLSVFPGYFINKTLWSFIMYKNYLLIALRNLNKNKGFSFINIFGLSIGITSCLLIMLFVHDELSFDKYNENSDRIYRLAYSGINRGRQINTARTPIPWAPVLKDEIPEIENAVRLRTPNSRFMVSYEDQKYFEKGFYFADSTLFNVFDIGLVLGDKDEVLRAPNSVVISERAAKKYFGNKNPVGERITADITLNLTITGIMKNIPANSHFDFDFAISLSSLEEYKDANGRLIYGNLFDNWLWTSGYTYLLLNKSADIELVEEKIKNVIYNRIGDQLANGGGEINPFLQKLTDIHLRSNMQQEIGVNSDISYIYIFSAIAFFILVIACINFMNLSTARSSKRAVEVGMRKVVGASRKQLISQFLGESMILSLFSTGISLIMTYFFLPFFNDLTGKSIIISNYNLLMIFFGMIFISILVGIVSGSYPAFVISAFKPIEVMKGKMSLNSANIILRKSLVIAQFSISIILIIGLGVIMSQLDYIQNKRLGFNKEFLLSIPQPDPTVISKFYTLKENFEKNSNVLGVSASSSLPGGLFGTGFIRPFGSDQANNVEAEILSVDFDFVNVMQMELIDGRNFMRLISSDSMNAVIINKTAAVQLGFGEKAAGQEIAFGNATGNEIIGVVDDFHFSSLHEKIKPYVFYVNGYNFLWVLTRINSEDITSTISFLPEYHMENLSTLPNIPLITILCPQSNPQLHHFQKPTLSYLLSAHHSEAFLTLRNDGQRNTCSRSENLQRPPLPREAI